MDDEETKSCPNCKREIPAVNFTIHSVHCARNIRICPVCKEPVPGSELDDHHQKMHKLLPCKQCGESVCGTDLEDHIRDSCANTVKSCRFCDLELPRRELPAHEVYCGVRTEQCPDCKEFVMIKYQQLHIDSNHGFIRLDDDPAPPKKEPPRLNLSRQIPKSNLDRPNTAPSPKINNVAQRPTSIFDNVTRPSSDNRPSSSNASTNSPSSFPCVKNRPPPNSGVTPSSFGNPRPNVRPSPNLGASLPSGSDSRQSSSINTPESSYNDLVPSQHDSPPDSVYNPRPGSFNDRLPSDSVYNPRPGSFNDRLGLIFATPLPNLPSSNSGLGSPNSRPNLASSRQDPSNIIQGSLNSEQVPPNTKQSSSNFQQGSSNPRPSDPRQGSSNSRQGSSNSRQGSSNPRQGLSNTVQDWPNIIQDSSNPRQGSSDGPSSSNNRPSNFDIAGRLPNSNNSRNITKNEVVQGSLNSGDRPSMSNISPQEVSPSVVRASGVKKRTNDQPQINMDTTATKTVDKDLGAVSRGAVKKRPAPQPPRSARRDLPYYSAVQRQQREERDRQLQNEYNLAHGLPPVLNPAQKIEKLRKLDALQNRDYEEEYRRRQRRPSPEQGFEQGFEQGYRLGGPQDLDEATRMEFKNLKPMSPNQFMKRFSSLQVSPPAVKEDRFPEIKSSLRELRRGLNEVTAPYNANNNATASNNNNNERVRAGRETQEEVQLPCEFCSALVPADDLVQHQTGCRPDLAQLVPASPSPPHPASPIHRHQQHQHRHQHRHQHPQQEEYSPQHGAAASPPADPVIPCEFCMRSLPVYLIIEHQERCIQENMPV